MDKAGKEAANRWEWLPSFMPGVQRQLQEQRAKHGSAWVNECWKRGVLNREPGWFFAVEGALAIGVPDDDQRLAWFAALRITTTQSLLYIRLPEAAHGTH